MCSMCTLLHYCSSLSARDILKGIIYNDALLVKSFSTDNISNAIVVRSYINGEESRDSLRQVTVKLPYVRRSRGESLPASGENRVTHFNWNSFPIRAMRSIHVRSCHIDHTRTGQGSCMYRTCIR